MTLNDRFCAASNGSVKRRTAPPLLPFIAAAGRPVVPARHSHGVGRHPRGSARRNTKPRGTLHQEGCANAWTPSAVVGHLRVFRSKTRVLNVAADSFRRNSTGVWPPSTGTLKTRFFQWPLNCRTV